MKSNGDAVRPARGRRDRLQLAWLVTIGFALVHTAAVWGRVDVFIWRDLGRWLHEIERFAGGEVPYRDFGWQFPPLTMWLLGGWARLFGTGLNAVWTATSAIYVLICVQFLRYVRRVVSPSAVLPVAASGLLLSAAYANVQSAPLPLGMYVPAAPLGFLLLLTGAMAVFDAIESGHARSSWIAGITLGLTVLTKQDFWIPALYLVAVGATVLGRRGTRAGGRSAAQLGGGFAMTIVAGAIPVVATTGLTALPDILTGYGSASVFLGRGLPTWERLSTELTVLAILAVLCLSALIAARAVRGARFRWLVGISMVTALVTFGVHVMLDYSLAVSGDASSLLNLPAQPRELATTALAVARELMLHALPVLLPVGVLLLVLRHWKELEPGHRDRLALMIGLCVTARARRAFEYTEWYHFLLELPVYVYALEQLVPWHRPARRIALAIGTVGAIALGAFSYWYLGVGVLTRHNWPERLRTAKGTVHVGVPVAREYRELDAALERADPTGSRPLLVFGYASFNYFLDRPNPSASTAGLRFIDDPEAAIAAALKVRPLVLDNLRFLRGTLPVSRLEPGTWRQPTRPSFYRTFDRSLFARVLVECDDLLAEVHDPLDRPHFRIYDCATGRGKGDD